MTMTKTEKMRYDSIGRCFITSNSLDSMTKRDKRNLFRDLCTHYRVIEALHDAKLDSSIDIILACIDNEGGKDD